jgi:hypothetical protein
MDLNEMDAMNVLPFATVIGYVLIIRMLSTSNREPMKISQVCDMIHSLFLCDFENARMFF